MSNVNLENQTYELRDYGPNPIVFNIEDITVQNQNHRTVLWTGHNFQLNLMNIDVNEFPKLHVHYNFDEYANFVNGQGMILLGDRKDKLDSQVVIAKNHAYVIPAGKWHNVINTGITPLQFYLIYAPPRYPFGTIHITEESEKD